MKKHIEISGRKIGLGQPVYIIAEAGVNHNGNLQMALDLVREAKRRGADCVKFQTFKAEAIVTKKAPKAAYQMEVTDPQESQLEMLRKLELGAEDYRKIIALCKELGIHFLSTPYGFEDSVLLHELGVGAFKIASGQLVELPFLKFTAAMKKPLIVSTGMATMEEVEAAVKTIRSTGNEDLIILQCTTNYPSRTEDANIRAMVSMQNTLHVLTGFSDHSENHYAVFAAVALGATVVEKHFTLDKKLPGPDHSSSLEPQDLEEMVTGIRAIESALGNGIKSPCEAEARNLSAVRRSIVAAGHISKGQIIQREDLIFKRPATGLDPNLLEDVIGKRAKEEISADQPLSENSIDW